jgi:hypothetical protein
MQRLNFPPSVPRRLRASVALAEGIALSTLYGMKITPGDVARVLSDAGVRYVLIGAHAINLNTGRPRATRDVDVVVASTAKAVRAFQRTYPQLSVERHPALVRFKDQDQEVVDLIKSSSNDLFKRVLKLAHRVSIAGVTIAVAKPEAALGTKFFSMSNPALSHDDRMQDAVDFSRAAKLQQRLDFSILWTLAELVYSGGGDACLKLVADAKAGRKIQI